VEAARIIGELEPTLCMLAEASAIVIQAIQSECRGQTDSRHVSMEAVSGRSTSAALHHVLARGRLPDRQEAKGLAEDILAAVRAIPETMSAAHFEAVFHELYEVQWRAEGALNLTAFPPSSLLLGRDVRPPLTRPPGAPAETDAYGTDRSVYSRYASYRPGDPASRPPFRSASSRCVQPVTRRQHRDVAAETVHNACLPYGLRQESHRAVLYASHHGLGLAEHPGQADAGVGNRRDLRRVCVELRVDTADDVTEMVRQLARDRTIGGRTPGHTTLIEAEHWAVDGCRPDQFAAHLDRITQVVIRRLWKALHGLELYVEERICSCSLEMTIKVSLQRAVPAALAQWDAPAMDAAEGPELAPEQDLDRLMDAQRLVDAQNATSDLLMRNSTVATQLLLLQPGWQDVYDELVTADRRRYLSSTEFARWCREVVPGAGLARGAGGPK